MSSPSSPALQRLDRLDKSSPDFHDQLCNVLYGEEYVESAPHLQHDDAMWLVDYLDTVRRYVALPRSLHSTRRSFSTVSILPVPVSRSVCACSEAYVAPEQYSQHRTRFHLAFSTSISNRSPQGGTAMCTRGPSMV